VENTEENPRIDFDQAMREYEFLMALTFKENENAEYLSAKDYNSPFSVGGRWIR
jgi:hypothetical protein